MRPVLILVTVAFAAFTGWLIIDVGYLGLFRQLLATPLGWQVLADIVIALSIVTAWLRRDARRQGRPFWPFFVLTLTLGSLGPLLYLLTRKGAGRA
jgi:hypothetical protein